MRCACVGTCAGRQVYNRYPREIYLATGTKLENVRFSSVSVYDIFGSAGTCVPKSDRYRGEIFVRVTSYRTTISIREIHWQIHL